LFAGRYTYQLHRSMSSLRKNGLPCEEYPQTVGNCTAMGQALFDLLTGQNLRAYPSSDLRRQALNTVSVEHARGWRIAKEKSSKKSDAIVALAMACVATLDQGNAVVVALTPREIREVWQEAAQGEADAPCYTERRVTSWEDVNDA
jgi:hypothetical protein